MVDSTAASLQREIESERLSAGRVSTFLASIRNAARRAVGSLAAQRILYKLSKLIK